MVEWFILYMVKKATKVTAKEKVSVTKHESFTLILFRMLETTVEIFTIKGPKIDYEFV